MESSGVGVSVGVGVACGVGVGVTSGVGVIPGVGVGDTSGVGVGVASGVGVGVGVGSASVARAAEGHTTNATMARTASQPTALALVGDRRRDLLFGLMSHAP